VLSRSDFLQIQAWNVSSPECIFSCVPELISVHVKFQPESLAICAWDGSFTYAELEEISSRVAQKLVQCGVLPKSNVPICFEKSRWTVVAMLAIMKAGAAFVPLDPTQPVKRIREISQEVGAKFVVASVTGADPFISGSDQIVVILDDNLIDSLSMENFPTRPPTIFPDQPALIMFTVR
jgi:non-ribosomal peptide synthetase component F